MSPSALFVTTVPITLEAFLLPFSDHFRARGWRVDAVANGAQSHAALERHFDACFDVTWSRNPLAPSNLLTAARHLRSVVARGDYDIVHVHTPVAAFVTRWALRHRPRGARPRVIYTAHGFHFYRGQGALAHAAFLALEKAAARWTDFLVTINAEDHAAACSFSGITRDRVRLIEGIGVDTDAYGASNQRSEQAEHTRALLGLSPDDVVVTMIAEFIPRKNHRLALEAMARVADPRVRLLLVGTGPLEGALREAVARANLTHRVIFAGYRRDIADLLAASDAGLLVSHHEGLARSVLECMAAGRPVIGTDTRGIADAVSRDCGWIVPRNDAPALAEAIDEAAASAPERARRGQAARERVASHYALPLIIEAYEELYGEALASTL